MPRTHLTVGAAWCVTALVAAPSEAREKLAEHTGTRSAGPPGPRAQVEDMAWLAGHGTGEALGGTVDEIWSPPREETFTDTRAPVIGREP